MSQPAEPYRVSGAVAEAGPQGQARRWPLCCVIVLALSVIALTSAVLALRRIGAQLRCSQRLKQIHLQALMYADDKRGVFPYADGSYRGAERLLIQTGYLSAPDPGCEHTRAPLEGFQAPFGIREEGDLLLLWETAPHSDGGRVVVTRDGMVSYVLEAEFAHLLADHDRAAAKRRAEGPPRRRR